MIKTLNLIKIYIFLDFYIRIINVVFEKNNPVDI